MSILVFISYATKDTDIFQIPRISEGLTVYKEIDDVLYWQEDVEDNIIEYMNENLNKCDVVILFCSPNAMDSTSVKKEWTAADASDKPLIPVFTNPKYIPTLLKTRKGVQINDVFDVQENIKQLYKLIKKKYVPKEASSIDFKLTYKNKVEKVKAEKTSTLLEILIKVCKKYNLSVKNVSLTTSGGERLETEELDDPIPQIYAKHGNEFDITIERMQITASFKICIMGDSNVGKSGLLKQCIEGHFDADLKKTVGTDYWIKPFTLQSQDQKFNINFLFWDFVGFKQFSGPLKLENLDQTDGVFIVGDVTNKESFERIEKYWLPEIRKHLIKIPIILLANKADLPHKIEKEEVESIANAFGINKVFWTSAKTGQNIETAFKSILFPILEQELKKL